MLAIPSIEHADAQGRPLKPKTLPCKYCSKRFRRVEHVQRHERTHTKEKPFACNWDMCGKTFGRRDLLVRHEKLVHLNDNTKDAARPRKASSGSGQTNSSDDHADLMMSGGMSGHSQRRLSSSYTTRPVPSLGSGLLPPPPPHAQPHSHAHSTDPRLATSRTIPACNLDLLSDAATHLASTEIHPMAQSTPYHDRTRSDSNPTAVPQQSPAQHVQHGQHGQHTLQGQQGQQGQPPAASFEDYHLFLDDFTSPSSHFLPSALESDPGFGLWGQRLSGGGSMGNGLAGLSSSRMPGSSFPSTRFPSAQPDMRDINMHPDAAQRMQDEMAAGHGLLNNGSGSILSSSASMRPPPWRLISVADHNIIKNRLEEFSSVLPTDFVCPSRHTLARFLEGYVSGFHEHLPFLHLPTLAPAELSPELILAILAVGAQYRFESHRGNALWYAAKAVALEQIRRRHSHEVHRLLPTSAAYSPHSTRPSPSTGFRHSFTFTSVHGVHDRPLTQDTHREPYSPNTPQARLETIQALLLLFAVGLWGPKAILSEACSLQSQLAVLVREEGLDAIHQPASDWETWIRVEGSTRTKLIAFSFFNLCSVVYNTPPLLLTAEVNLMLPQPSRLWRMETAWQWQEARQQQQQQQGGIAEFALQDTFWRILHQRQNQNQSQSPSQQPPLHLEQMSSLGSYVLIHCFIQHIYLLKQTQRGLLRVEDVDEIAQGLRTWQIGFEQHRQNKPDMNGGGGSGGGGPVEFNSTALLRLAYIRLYTDNTSINTSGRRRLETRDPTVIAHAFHTVPLLARGPTPGTRTPRAVVQAIHALAMLVKQGVNYVARTKSLEWSMQQSLCNMECALLLSKWLVTLASIDPESPADAVTAEEKSLLDNVRRLLDETEFAVPIDPSLASQPAQGGNNTVTANESVKLRQLAVAVIQLWAETFKGTHLFEVVGVMGQGLEQYADLLEKEGPASNGLRTPRMQV